MKLVLGAVLVTLAGCIVQHDHVNGSGPTQSQPRTAGSFTRILVEGSPNVIATVGRTAAVTIEAQRNIADLIETTVSGGTLTISDKKEYSSDSPVVVHVTVPLLEAYSLHGSSNANVSGVVGSAFSIEIAGAGNIEAAGRVDRLTIECSGAGNAQLRQLQARDAIIHVSGVGNADVNVSGTLDVTIAGVGSVVYRGSPRIVHKAIMGVGSLTPG